MNSVVIVPAVLTQSKDEVLRKARMTELYSSRFHIDIEDGLFVPEQTIMFNFMDYLNTKARVELHLMVRNPLSVIQQLLMHRHKPSLVIFHREACRTQAEANYLVEHLHKHNIQASIALSPETKVSAIDKCALYADELLVMTVHPGKKGQEFIKQELKKVKELRKLFPDKNIAVDGGINTKNIGSAVRAGANILIANSAVFGEKEMGEAMEELKASAEKIVSR